MKPADGWLLSYSKMLPHYMYYLSLPGKGAGFEVQDASVHVQDASWDVHKGKDRAWSARPQLQARLGMWMASWSHRCLLGHSPFVPRMLLCHPLPLSPCQKEKALLTQHFLSHNPYYILILIAVYLHTFASLVLFLNLGFLGWGTGPFCTGHKDKTRTSVSRAATQRLNHVSE